MAVAATGHLACDKSVGCGRSGFAWRKLYSTEQAILRRDCLFFAGKGLAGERREIGRGGKELVVVGTWLMAWL